jgi:hypothetical protein
MGTCRRGLCESCRGLLSIARTVDGKVKRFNICARKKQKESRLADELCTGQEKARQTELWLTTLLPSFYIFGIASKHSSIATGVRLSLNESKINSSKKPEMHFLPPAKERTTPRNMHANMHVKSPFPRSTILSVQYLHHLALASAQPSQLKIQTRNRPSQISSDLIRVPSPLSQDAKMVINCPCNFFCRFANR